MKLSAHALVALISLALAPGGAEAVPEVIGYDLVSSVRVSRTTFDYTYRLRVQGDSISYTESAISVSTALISGTTVTKSRVDIGRIEAGQLFRPKDTFVIRQDRQIPLDPATIRFSFIGVPAAGPTTGSQSPIGQIRFEQESTSGHGGNALLQGPPLAGSVIGLLVDTLEATETVQFRLKGSDGQVFQQGSMQLMPGGSTWGASIQVPSASFRLELDARLTSGYISTSVSPDLLEPAPQQVSILFATTSAKAGQRLPVEIQIHSIAANGTHTFTLSPPVGFSLDQSSWTISLVPGGTASLRSTLTIPYGAKPYQQYSMVATLSSTVSSFDYWKNFLIK